MPPKRRPTRLQNLFDEVEDFWDCAQGDATPKTGPTDAEQHAGHIEDAAEAKDFAKAAEHLKLLMGTCQTCHTKYRDGCLTGPRQQ